MSSTFVCSITPFARDGSLDEAAARAHFRRMADAGIGVYAGGSSPGEQYALTPDEVERLLRAAVAECKGRVPVRAMGVEPRHARAMREFAALNPENPPPIRIALPGMCFRYEQITARSEIQFNQVEGLVVGEHITFADLKGTLIDFARRMFGQNVRTRFRASYFPFTEPSAEMDVECFVCGGKGCQVCKNSGWLEILGCGMVHPIVLQNGGYDPTRYSGFAWGMGPERQLMLRYKIDDIRYFWGNDLRFLEQF